MKQQKPYYFMQFTLQELHNAAVRQENGLFISSAALRRLLLDRRSMPFGETAEIRSMLLATATSAAPNAVCRQIFAIRPEIEPECDKMMPSRQDAFLQDLLYIDLNVGVDAPLQMHWTKQLLDGITIDFGTQQIRYVLFERSASQTRQNQLLMIRESLYFHTETISLHRVKLSTLAACAAVVRHDSAHVQETDGLRITDAALAEVLQSAPLQVTEGNFVTSELLHLEPEALKQCLIWVEEDVVPSAAAECPAEDLRAFRLLPVRIPLTVDPQEPPVMHRLLVDVRCLEGMHEKRFAQAFIASLYDRISCGLEREPMTRISKHAAYRALMMTSGCFVEPIRRFFSPATVAVVEDFTVRQFREMAGESGETSGRCVSVQMDENMVRQPLFYASLEDRDVSDDKLFDGEGLISAELGRYLAQNVAAPGEALPTSFQIRMPFVKGVVHTLDLRRLLRETFPAELKTLQIQDIFGKWHDVRSLHMILTKSMFKAYPLYKFLLEQYKSSLIPGVGKLGKIEGMKLYFDRFRLYGHTLVVSGTDRPSQRQSAVTVSNYQFLSTLAAEEDAQKIDLLRPSLQALECIRQSERSCVADLLLSEELREELKQEQEASGTEGSKELPETEEPEEAEETPERHGISDFLKRNPGLLQTAPFAKKRDTARLCRELGRGHILLHGTMKLLSGDLVQLVWMLLHRVHVFDPVRHCHRLPEAHLIRPALEAWKAEILEETDFYAPGCAPGRPAVMDRNPHLTRNEHLRMTSMRNPGTLRETYFGHLHGVVMVRVGVRQVAASLGGADFDGDMVRIFWQPAYLNAVPQDNAEQSPPVNIPALAEGDKVFNAQNRKDLITSASGSKVGLYSNKAFRVSLYAYGSRKLADTKELRERFLRKLLREHRVEEAEALAKKLAAKPLHALPADDFPEAVTEVLRTVQDPGTWLASREIIELSCGVGLDIDSVKTGVRPELNEQDSVLNVKKSGNGNEDKENEPEEDQKKKKKPITPMDFFLDFKDHPKQVKKLPHLAEGDAYSLVEYLPVIFCSKDLDKLPAWVEHCCRSAKAKPETCATVTYPRQKLSAMLEETPAVTSRTLPLLWMFQALGTLQEIRRRNSFSEAEGKEKNRLTLEHALMQVYGVSGGRAMLSEHLLPLADTLTDEAAVTALILRTTDWIHMGHADLRRLFYHQCRPAALPQVEKDSTLERCLFAFKSHVVCSCDLMREMIDAAEAETLSSALLQRLAHAASADQSHIRDELKSEELAELTAFHAALRELTAEERHALKTALYPEDPERFAVRWRTETDREQRRKLLTQLFPGAKAEAIGLLAEPAAWLVLPAFLAYCRSTAVTRRKRFSAEAMRRYAKETWPMEQVTDAAVFAAVQKILGSPETPAAEQFSAELAQTKQRREALIALREDFSPQRVTQPWEQLFVLAFSLMQEKGAMALLMRAAGASGASGDPAQEERESLLALLALEEGEADADLCCELEKVAFRALPEALYALVRQENGLEPVEGFCGDQEAGYLDGAQCLMLEPAAKAEGEVALTTYVVPRNSSLTLEPQPMPEGIRMEYLDGKTPVERLEISTAETGVQAIAFRLMRKNRRCAKGVLTVTVLPAGENGGIDPDYALCAPYTARFCLENGTQTDQRPFTELVYGYRKFRLIPVQTVDQIGG